MLKVKNEIALGKYKVLFLDGHIPLDPFTQVNIDGVIMNVIIPYDLKNSIAVESNNIFINKSVIFI